MIKTAGAAAALTATFALTIGGLPILITTAIAGPGPPSQAAITEIPAGMLAHYQHAGTRCAAINWATLAAIGQVETGHGQHRIDPRTGDTIGPPILGYQPIGPDTDHGHYDNDPTHDWAVGPMQLAPTTFAAYATTGEGRPAGTTPDPWNAWDAIATAGRYLCELSRILRDARIASIVAAYNCGPNAPAPCGTDYATHVLAAVARYQHGGTGAGVLATGDVAVLITTALAQLGKPYVFGTQGPDTFDCAGLITYTYRSIGITIPAYTFTQVTHGQAVPIDQIQAGDLIFTRGGVPAEDFGHVALAISTTQEIQAPHTGDIVRIVPIDPRRIEAVRRILDPESHAEMPLEELVATPSPGQKPR